MGILARAMRGDRVDRASRTSAGRTYAREIIRDQTGPRLWSIGSIRALPVTAVGLN